jgi:mRNA interferase RelE/StbE
MYKLLIEKQVEKQLEKIAEPDYTKIKAAILDLAHNPRPAGYKKLKGRFGYRIRKGNYRIVYDIDDNILTVYIVAAGHRKDIYE